MLRRSPVKPDLCPEGLGMRLPCSGNRSLPLLLFTAALLLLLPLSVLPLPLLPLLLLAFNAIDAAMPGDASYLGDGFGGAGQAGILLSPGILLGPGILLVSDHRRLRGLATAAAVTPPLVAFLLMSDVGAEHSLLLLLLLLLPQPAVLGSTAD